ncbi:hypothetical protein [Streptomyces sp. A3M-1-3]|uniref:hypothetical protein n=1 Tax=Streptomyces sp. A3M-1-3 TaxID=2962044 RepID=UPI0035ABE455
MARGRLTDGRHADGRPTDGRPTPDHREEVRLPLPPTLAATLGCDAVGVPARHGFRLMTRLPRSGCVFADEAWWWWIVPAGSDQDLAWPAPARYATGGCVPGAHPRLIRHPEATTPYTPPIPLYLMVCQLAGATPVWTPSGTGGRRE